MAYINIIGAGRLGLHWLVALSNLTSHCIQQVVSKHLDPKDADWPVISTLAKLKPADISIICVADDQLQSTIHQLSEHVEVDSSQVFIHCAGRYSSDILSPLANLGAQTAAIHPLKAFTQTTNAHAFNHCPISLEGNPQAIKQIEPVLRELGARPFLIDKAQKPLYHSACTIASNGLVGLVHAANQLFTACGISSDLAQQLTLSLLSTSLNNCHSSDNLLSALTGPIARGDKQTVKAHLDSLANQLDIKQLYCSLSAQILSLTNVKEELHDWLESN